MKKQNKNINDMLPKVGIGKGETCDTQHLLKAIQFLDSSLMKGSILLLHQYYFQTLFHFLKVLTLS